MSPVKHSALALALIASAAASLIAAAGPATAAATGYCLDSGGDNSAVRVPAYLYRDCSNPSTNLRWLIEGGQIKTGDNRCLAADCSLGAPRRSCW